MTSIVFENDGEIDIRAIRTFGVSVKESANPIGFFGTGLKYAIGILLRERQGVVVYAGLDRYEFGIERAEIRGEEFNIVTMNGDELGFTTDVGKTWQMWMAYRELYCNAIDEGGGVHREQEPTEPQEGKTIVIVRGDAFARVHDDRASFILAGKPIHVGEVAEIYEGECSSVFYRGIKVARLPQHGQFTYNITRSLDLTEDRTAKYQFQYLDAIGRTIIEHDDKNFINRTIFAPDEALERNLDLSDTGGTPSQTFLTITREAHLTGRGRMNETALKVMRSNTIETLTRTPKPLTKIEKAQIDRATSFCRAIGFPVNEYPLTVVESLGTLIEEYAHLRHGYQDCSRAFQNFLFDRLVTIGEDYVWGEPL